MCLTPAGNTTGTETMRTRRVLAAIAFAVMPLESSANDDFCEVVEGNYLQNPMFAQRNATGGLQYWVGSQHAGEKSYDVESGDGGLTIIKTGTQPWYYLRQNLAAKEIAGKKLALTVELKLNLQQSRRATVGGGVKIVARSSGLQGRKLLLRSTFDHQPRNGKTDWFPVQVVVQLPGETDTVEVGFLHQADGTLQVRNPSFQLVDESNGPCAVSPNAILGLPQPSSTLKKVRPGS